MNLSEYILLAASSLFVIVDPLATVPAFLAMTPSDTPEQRIRTARLACCVAASVLLVFSIAGQLLFKVMDITMPAFQIAASIVLLLVAFEERAAGLERDIRDSQKRAKEFESKVNAPFEHDKRYHQLAERQAEIEEKLDLTKNQASSQVEAASGDEREDNSQKQSEAKPVKQSRRAAVRV
ncbi:MAG TPA: MarC family protein [Verrucomicrobiae bacterium]|nr:MarC family protein [Verrucomicrobiae bacterium]